MEDSFVIAILKLCLVMKSCQPCIEALAGLLFASDISCHLEVGLSFFVVYVWDWGFFVCVLEQETTISHLVDRINTAIIAAVI